MTRRWKITFLISASCYVEGELFPSQQLVRSSASRRCHRVLQRCLCEGNPGAALPLWMVGNPSWLCRLGLHGRLGWVERVAGHNMALQGWKMRRQVPDCPLQGQFGVFNVRLWEAASLLESRKLLFQREQTEIKYIVVTFS